MCADINEVREPVVRDLLDALAEINSADGEVQP